MKRFRLNIEIDEFTAKAIIILMLIVTCVSYNVPAFQLLAGGIALTSFTMCGCRSLQPAVINTSPDEAQRKEVK